MRYEVVSVVLKDVLTASAVCVSQVSFGYIFAKAKMVTFALVSSNGSSQVTHTFAVAELTKHHYEKLVPTREMLYIFISSVFSDKVVEVIPV